MKKETTLPPKIKLPGLNMSENCYIVNNDKYDVSNLIRFCQEKKYQPFDMPLAGICFENLPFSISNFISFCNHIKRVNNTDLNYPIIIDNYGYVADGWHRIAKAILLGKRTIKAIRMEEMPSPSGKNDD